MREMGNFMGEQGAENTFKNLLEEQKKLIAQYEVAVKQYEANNIYQENQVLRQELEKLKEAHEALKKNYEVVKRDASGLKWALEAQILNEKMSFISGSQEKLNLYFKNTDAKMIHKLKQVEDYAVQESGKIQIAADKALQGAVGHFNERISELKEEINREVLTQQQRNTEAIKQLEDNIEGAYERLKNEPLSEEMIQKRIKQNNMEAKIGLHWLNKVGILLILIGVVTVMRYSFTNYFTNELKGIFGMVVGIIFLLGGECFNRKEKKVFSQGLIGGGIGIFYLTIFCSYFILNIMTMPVAMGLCLLTSVATFVLSMRYDSKTIAGLGLIGGYLPLLAYSQLDEGIRGMAVYISMGYVLILNGVTLMLSIRKDWRIIHGLSFFTNMPLVIVLAMLSEQVGIGILYSFINFVAYMGILLVYPIRFKTKLSSGRSLMVGCNTVVSCGLLWILFDKANLQNWMGILAVAFCIVYYILSEVMRRYTPEEKGTQTIFHLTALTFAILIMPLQLGMVYLTFGWLIESVLLIGYGLRIKHKGLASGGRIIFGLSVCYFYLVEYTNQLAGRDFIFYMKYFGIILGLVIILVLYLCEKEYKEHVAIQSKRLQIYKYFVLLTVWAYLLDMGYSLNGQLGSSISQWVGPSIVTSLIFSLLTVGMLYGISKIKALQDQYTTHLLIGGYALVDLVCILQNFSGYVYESEQKGVAIGLLIIWNVLVLISVKNIIRLVVVKEHIQVEVYPFVLALYLLGTMTVILSGQFNLALTSVGMSIFYIVSAFIMIVCGFRYSYRWIRYWGLGLCILATGKLFLFDFAIGVAVAYKVISYFSFGFVLLGISYLYQKFSKRLEVPVSLKSSVEEEE